MRSNLYLAGFDQHLQASGLFWLRYADNIVLLESDGERLRTVWEKAVRYLENPCQLKLNPESVALTTVRNGFEFLGFWFEGEKRLMSPARLDQKRASLSTLLRQNPAHLPGLPVGESLRDHARLAKLLRFRTGYAAPIGIVGAMALWRVRVSPTAEVALFALYGIG